MANFKSFLQERKYHTLCIEAYQIEPQFFWAYVLHFNYVIITQGTIKVVQK